MEGQHVQDFLLLQMADSAFPTGAFAYSSGLEAMVEFGLVQNEEELSEYIFDFTRQAIAFELPFLSSFYNMADKPDELKPALQTYDASFVTAGMYEGSLNLGKNWMRILQEVIMEEKSYLPVQQFLKKTALPGHFLFVAVLSMKAMGFGKEKIKTFFISSIIRDQVSAAIRLGVIGPMQGHSIQFLVYSQLSGNGSSITEEDYRRARRTGFITDVAQMLQKNVYSKLFKN